jgi:hypothetical protein
LSWFPDWLWGLQLLIFTIVAYVCAIVLTAKARDRSGQRPHPVWPHNRVSTLPSVRSGHCGGLPLPKDRITIVDDPIAWDDAPPRADCAARS